jgi:hypothetical protein
MSYEGHPISAVGTSMSDCFGKRCSYLLARLIPEGRINLISRLNCKELRAMRRYRLQSHAVLQQLTLLKLGR